MILALILALLTGQACTTYAFEITNAWPPPARVWIQTDAMTLEAPLQSYQFGVARYEYDGPWIPKDVFSFIEQGWSGQFRQAACKAPIKLFFPFWGG